MATVGRLTKMKKDINDAIRTICAAEGRILSRDQMREVRKRFIKGLRAQRKMQ